VPGFAIHHNLCAVQRAGLDGGSRVLLFGTEGATDPQLYRQLMANEAVSAESQEVRT
jgi:hypothetical protein